MTQPTIKPITDIAPNFTMFDFIGRSWRGKEKLWLVFWVYGLVGCVLVRFATVGLLSQFGFSGIVLALILAVAFWTWLIVSLWRNAFHTRFRALGYGVRALALVLTLSFAAAAWFVTTKGRDEIAQMEAHRAMCQQQLQQMASSQADPAAYVAKNQAWLQQCESSYAVKPSGTVDSPERFCENRLKLYALQVGIKDTASYIKDNQALLDNCLKQARGAQ